MNPETRLKRLRYRSCHRGCKETDIVLGNFSETGLGRLSPGLIDLYERFLDEDDANIWDWLIGKTAPNPDYLPLLELLKKGGS